MKETLRRHAPIIITVGLALVFFANSYAAWFAPDEFRDILQHSFLQSLGVDNLVKFIGISDGLVALLLLLGKARKLVAFYAAVWLIGVILVSRPIEVPNIFEHLGFLAMAIYLYLAA